MYDSLAILSFKTYARLITAQGAFNDTQLDTSNDSSPRVFVLPRLSQACAYGAPTHDPAYQPSVITWPRGINALDVLSDTGFVASFALSCTLGLVRMTGIPPVQIQVLTACQSDMSWSTQ